MSHCRKLAEYRKEKAMTERDANRGMQEAPQGAQEWLSQMQQLAEQIQKQQQNSQQMAQQWMEQAQQQQQMFQQQAEQQQQSFQQMVQESMNTYMQMFNIPHSYLQEGMRLAQEDAPGSQQERSTGRIEAFEGL